MMGKGFLDSLDEAFGEDMLAEVIPVARKKAEKKNPSTSIAREREKESRPARRATRKRKSFFDTIEEVLDRQNDQSSSPLAGIETQLDTIDAQKLRRLSAMISADTLIHLKKVAKQKGIPLSTLVEKALEAYLQKFKA